MFERKRRACIEQRLPERQKHSYKPRDFIPIVTSLPSCYRKSKENRLSFMQHKRNEITLSIKQSLKPAVSPRSLRVRHHDRRVRCIDIGASCSLEDSKIHTARIVSEYAIACSESTYFFPFFMPTCRIFASCSNPSQLVNHLPTHSRRAGLSLSYGKLIMII